MSNQVLIQKFRLGLMYQINNISFDYFTLLMKLIIKKLIMTMIFQVSKHDKVWII